MKAKLEALQRTLAAHPVVRRVRGLASSERAGDPLLIGLGAAVGLGTGLLAVALVELVAGVQRVAFAPLPDTVSVLVVPAAGALLVGLIVTYWTPEVRGGGVTHLMEAISLEGGRVRTSVPFAKVLASGLALGTGASGGRESPIVQIGGGVGSSLGRLFALSEEQKRSLIAGGAGAGIAATFNAPIAGMLFALEVIIGGFRARYLQVIVVACVVASVTARELVGPGLIYDPPPFRTATLGRVGWTGLVGEFLLYAVLGVAAVAVGLALINGERLVARFSARVKGWPPLHLAAGGLGVGVVALAVPEVLGTGDNLPPVLGVNTDPIAEMLAGTLGTAGATASGVLDGLGGAGLGATAVLLVLLAAKLLASSLTIGTGNAVGSFAPAIFCGAALGGALGHAAEALMPVVDAQPGAFALVGMAAVVGATTRAPLTAILIIFELTGDYGMVLPLMLATGLATVGADQVQRGSVFTLPLLRRGILYTEPTDIDIMQTVSVGEVMTADPKAVRADMPLSELQAQFRRTRRHGFPVVDDNDRLLGVVTLSDLARAAEATGGAPGGDEAMVATGDIMAIRQRTAGDICTRRPATVTPGDPMFRALRRMAALDVGRMPVVDPEDHGRLVGLIRRSDIVEAYQRAVTRSLGVQQRHEASRLRDLAGVHFIEVVVTSVAPAAGQAVRDIDWPQRTVLTSIRRDANVIMPTGDTVLEPGDEVTLLTDVDSVETVRARLGGEQQ